jgi:hypothetical protein
MATGISLNSKVTIAEGVTFYVAEGQKIVANYNSDGGVGQLIVNGTSENPVLFTRLPGSPAYWGHINFEKNYNSIKNCILEYGGNSGNDPCALYCGFEAGGVELENVIVRNSDGNGIALRENSSKPNYSNVTFSNNKLVNVYVVGSGIGYNSLDEVP